MDYMYINMNENSKLENIKMIKNNMIDNKKLSIFFILIIIVYIILAILIFKKNPYQIITNYNALSIVFSLFGGFIILMIFFFIKRKKELYKPNETTSPTIVSYISKLFLTIISFAIVGLIIFGVVYFFKNVPTLSYTILYLLNVAIFIGFLTIVYTFIKPFLSNQKNPYLKLIIDIITYIPCLLLSFINYLVIQYKITTKPVWLLFTFQLFLIMLYFILPKLFDKIIKHDGLLLLSNPTTLTQKKTIGTFEILNKKNLNSFHYNYAISMWVYLDAMPPSTNTSYSDNATILSYGGKPNIYYNGTTNELIISAKIGNKDEIIFRTKDIKYQKWLNLIINYQGGTMDIFINNKLVLSVKNIVPYMKHDSITIGKKDGIYGFISDVNYFNKSITKDKISWIFKTTKI